MTSAPKFIQQIEMEDPTLDYTHNFNKMMVLYRLLGGHQNISISTKRQETGLKFDVKARTKRDASNICSYVNSACTYTVYGSDYEVSSVCEQKIVSIDIRKKKQF